MPEKTLRLQVSLSSTGREFTASQTSSVSLMSRVGPFVMLTSMLSKVSSSLCRTLAAEGRVANPSELGEDDYITLRLPRRLAELLENSPTSSLTISFREVPLIKQSKPSTTGG